MQGGPGTTAVELHSIDDEHAILGQEFGKHCNAGRHAYKAGSCLSVACMRNDMSGSCPTCGARRAEIWGRHRVPSHPCPPPHPSQHRRGAAPTLQRWLEHVCAQYRTTALQGNISCPRANLGPQQLLNACSNPSHELHTWVPRAAAVLLLAPRACMTHSMTDGSLASAAESYHHTHVSVTESTKAQPTHPGD